jgi:hypothetical protein
MIPERVNQFPDFWELRMPTSVSASHDTPFSRQDAALRLAQDDATAICGHGKPLTPDPTPCQRPPGHDPEYGHRDSEGTDVRHVWQDDGRV